MKWRSNGTTFEFKIENYRKRSYGSDNWCDVTLSVNNEYFMYNEKGEFLEYNDVEAILGCLNELLGGTMDSPKELSFMEPNISFVFYPPRLVREVSYWIPIDDIDALTEIYAKLIIELELERGFSGQYYVIELKLEVLEKLQVYLTEITK